MGFFISDFRVGGYGVVLGELVPEAGAGWKWASSPLAGVA